MTGLLISVRSADEASSALAGGADVIDVKEPRRGALGAADRQVWQDVLDHIHKRRPVSCALGELRDTEQVLAGTQHTGGMAFTKVGLAGCAALPDWPQRWQRVRDALPPGTQLVAVVYADWQSARAPLPRQIIDRCAALNCRWLLLDTHSKSGGGLFQQLDQQQLHEILHLARGAGMQIVLAGSLQLHDLARAAACAPQYIGIRGAACPQGRDSCVSEELVRQLSSGLRRFCIAKVKSQQEVNSAPRRA